jgi:hypothetical protein
MDYRNRFLVRAREPEFALRDFDLVLGFAA